MKQLFISLSFILLLTISSFGQDPLRAKLETSYNAFINALTAKDGEKLKSSVSSHSYMMMKNQMASSGRKFPDDAFKMAPMVTMDLKKMKFLKAAENGPTANLVYYGNGPVGGEAFIIIQFVKESSQWKFEGVKQKSNSELVKKMKAKDMKFLDEKDFKPDGIMPVAPKEIIAGDYRAQLNITAYGYKANVLVNGNEQREVENESSSSMLMGGVKKGMNTIEIKLAPVPGKEQGSISVSVNALVSEEEKEVFTLEAEKPGMIIKKEFEVQ
jgi:hypothetical protein